MQDQREVISEFQKRAQAEDARVKDATNSRFYICVCFQNQEQMLEFCTKSGIDDITDKIFVDGMKWAKKLGIKLDTPVPPVRKIKKTENEYCENIIE
jgi:hypothetical protein